MMRRNLASIVFVVFSLAFEGGQTAAMAQQTSETPSPGAIYKVPKTKPGQQRPPPAQPQQLPAQPQQLPAQPQRQPRGPSAPSGGAPNSVQPQTPQTQGTQPGGGTSQAPLTDRVLQRKMGSEEFQRLLKNAEQTQAGTGRGAPMADRWFDVARPQSGSDVVRPSGTPFFQGGQPTVLPAPVTNGSFKPATVQDAHQTTNRYGGIPGGVVLEGVAAGLGELDDVRYDKRFNAFIVNDRAAYFMTVPPKTVAVLCRAIAEDDQERVGVSLGQVELVYGKVPEDSDLAWDLKIADHFLGDIVFAQNDWTAGYRFPDGFIPTPHQGERFHIAVFFNFNGFAFQTQQEEIRLSNVNFDVRLLPLTETVSADGNLLPDEDAIARGRTSEQYEANARHVADHISYYRRERIIDRMFAYGEVAAFIRALKRADFDLEALADNVPGG